jgi:hypothetical protein
MYVYQRVFRIAWWSGARLGIHTEPIPHAPCNNFAFAQLFDLAVHNLANLKFKAEDDGC